MGTNRSHHLFLFLQQCRSNAQTPRNVTSYSFPRSSSPTHKTKMVLQLDRTPIPEWVFTGHLRQISLPRRLLAEGSRDRAEGTPLYLPADSLRISSLAASISLFLASMSCASRSLSSAGLDGSRVAASLT